MYEMKKEHTKYAVRHESDIVKSNDKPAYPQHTAQNRLVNLQDSHVLLLVAHQKYPA
jgi:hypothetical protein